MGIEDIANNAKDLFDKNKDKIEDAIHSDGAEKATDSILDAAAGLANKVTGGKFTQQVSDLHDKADGAVGNE